jgi:hypothetical protein
MAKAGSEFNPLTEQQMQELRAQREKARLKKDKKLRKILTDEQYGKWVKAEQERLIKMQQMRERRGRGRGHGFGPGGPEGFRPDSTMGPMPGGPHRHHRPDSARHELPQAPGSEAKPVKMVE